MSDHFVSAQHLLGIYQRRLKMADDGITHPSAPVVAAFRELVNGLSTLKPDARVELKILDDRWQFKVAATGAVLAEINASGPESNLGDEKPT